MPENWPSSRRWPRVKATERVFASHCFPTLLPFPNLRNQRRHLPKTPPAKRFTTAAEYKSPCWRMIRGLLFRLWAGLRRVLGSLRRRRGQRRRSYSQAAGRNAGENRAQRAARFVCVLALAERGRVIAVVSDSASGELLDQPRGKGGFGYDPVFFAPEPGKTFAELTREEKNRLSHRGKAFRRLLADLASRTV